MFMKGYHKITALNCSSYKLVVEVRAAGSLGVHGQRKETTASSNGSLGFIVCEVL